MDFNTLATKETVQNTRAALESKKYIVDVVASKADALEKIKTLIPDQASVIHGTSVTLEQIGFVDYLKTGGHKWKDLHVKITEENDQEKRQKLRREATLSDFYLGSVHALVENGEFIIASNTASQLPSVVYNSQNLIFVVSTKKIVSTLEVGMTRLTEYVVPLEEKHMQTLYGSGTQLNKILIFKGESSYSTRKIQFILIEEDLGF